MQADGSIDRYAIGGAVGATFYLEPIATLDVDVFVSFKPQPSQLLVSSKPIFWSGSPVGHGSKRSMCWRTRKRAGRWFEEPAFSPADPCASSSIRAHRRPCVMHWRAIPWRRRTREGGQA